MKFFLDDSVNHHHEEGQELSRDENDLKMHLSYLQEMDALIFLVTFVHSLLNVYFFFGLF